MTDTRLSVGDSETIAAFLDKQLSEGERRDFLERLDRDEALYEVFVEAVRFQEAQADPRGSVVERLPARRSSVWMLPVTIAALVVLAILGPYLTRNTDIPTVRGLTRQLVRDERFEATLGSGWMEHGWRRTRGLTPVQGEVDSAFRIGVHSLDLKVALRLGRANDARLLLDQIEYELRAIDLGVPLQLAFQAIGEHLGEERPMRSALEIADEADTQAHALLDTDFGYGFGKWAEAGRLAARGGNVDLLHSRTYRRVLREIQSREWSESVTRELATIEEIVLRGGSDPDLRKLERAFTTIINES